MDARFDRTIHHRRSIRLKEFDYASSGAYFVTICVKDRMSLLSEISDQRAILTSLGHIVSQHWHRIPEWQGRAYLDEFVVMPNHIHGIVLLTDASPNVNDGEPSHVGAYKPHRQVDHSEQVHCAVYTPLHPGDALRGQLEGDPRGPHGTKPGSIGAIIQNFKKTTTREIRKHMVDHEFCLWQRNYHEHIIRDEAELERIREYIILNPHRWAEDIYNE